MRLRTAWLMALLAVACAWRRHDNTGHTGHRLATPFTGDTVTADECKAVCSASLLCLGVAFDGECWPLTQVTPLLPDVLGVTVFVKDVAPPMARAILPPMPAGVPRPMPERCLDTPGWTNLQPGAPTCDLYRTEGWCADGAVVDVWTAGAGMNFPERHCCACGGSAATATAARVPVCVGAGATTAAAPAAGAGAGVALGPRVIGAAVDLLAESAFAQELARECNALRRRASTTHERSGGGATLFLMYHSCEGRAAVSAYRQRAAAAPSSAPFPFAVRGMRLAGPTVCSAATSGGGGGGGGDGGDGGGDLNLASLLPLFDAAAPAAADARDPAAGATAKARAAHRSIGVSGAYLQALLCENVGLIALAFSQAAASADGAAAPEWVGVASWKLEHKDVLPAALLATGFEAARGASSGLSAGGLKLPHDAVFFWQGAGQPTSLVEHETHFPGEQQAFCSPRPPAAPPRQDSSARWHSPPHTSTSSQ
jgi:hypothetical protein